MKVAKYTEFPEKENPHKVSARTIYDQEHGQAVVITLRPGEALKKHITPVDVFFYILEGTGKVEVGEEVKEVSADTIIESPAKVPHRLFNESASTFRFLVVKLPKPTASTKVL